MNKDVLIFICGLHSIFFAVFHITFWKLFQWRDDLKKLALANKTIMQILNIMLIYIFLFTAFLCFFFTKDLYTTKHRESVFWQVFLYSGLLEPLSNLFSAH